MIPKVYNRNLQKGLFIIATNIQMCTYKLIIFEFPSAFSAKL